MKLSNKAYDILKQIVSIWLPALATLVLAVCNIWGLPYGEAIAGTITALATCIGTIIGISSRNYWANINNG